MDEELVRSKKEWKEELSQTTKELKSEWRTESVKVETTALANHTELQQKVANLEKKLEEDLAAQKTRLDSVVKRYEDNGIGDGNGAKPLWSEVVSQTQAVDSKIEGIVAEVQTLHKQTSELQQDIAEQDERSKRKKCAIIYGFKEPVVDKKADSDNVIDLLHQIHCDNVSVNSCFRLGKISDDPTAKPRPIKLVLSSEAQKEQVLNSAKNLRNLSNGLEKIYINQDLTPKQRELRQRLVKQLREREARGESNLIIIGDMIVTRRQRVVGEAA